MASRIAPPNSTFLRMLLAEYFGTGLLVTVVVGSGMMATTLSPNDVGLQLLQNSMATVFGLVVLIAIFAPVSGAHFNPAVTLVEWLLARRSPGRFPPSRLLGYVLAQCAGGISGAVLANAMFDVPQAFSSHHRATPAHLLAEAVATFGLLLVILSLVRTGRAAWVPPLVGSYIGAAYWFTSSTSFANPAVTVGRVFTESFAGIAAGSVPAFFMAQTVGALLGAGFAVLLFPQETTGDDQPGGGNATTTGPASTNVSSPAGGLTAPGETGTAGDGADPVRAASPVVESATAGSVR